MSSLVTCFKTAQVRLVVKLKLMQHLAEIEMRKSS